MTQLSQVQVYTARYHVEEGRKALKEQNILEAVRRLKMAAANANGDQETLDDIGHPQLSQHIAMYQAEMQS